MNFFNTIRNPNNRILNPNIFLKFLIQSNPDKFGKFHICHGMLGIETPPHILTTFQLLLNTALKIRLCKTECLQNFVYEGSGRSDTT